MSEVEPTEIAVEADAPRARRGRRMAAALAAVAVVGGGLFAGLSLADDGNAPEDPVRALLEAVERGDVLGALEQLDPGERDAIREPMIELVDELNRLDILSGADLGDLSGIEVTIDELELESERVADHVATVRITGGEGSYRFDASALPLGGFVRELVGDGLDDAVSEGEDELRSSGADDVVATVKRGDRWYVSLGYSVAEAARRDAGVAFDDLGEGVSPSGADSPEGAVQAMVDAAQELDLRGVLAVLPPGELGALQEYAGLFLDDAESAVDDLGGAFDVAVRSLELDSETDGDRAVVYVRDAAFDADLGDAGAMSYADGCATLTMPGSDPQEICPGDAPVDLFGDGLFGPGMIEGFGDVEPPELSFEGEQPPYGIATVRVDGEWFVSPTRTVLDLFVETARLFEPRDLQEIRRFVEDVFGALEEQLSSGWDVEGFGLDPELEACFESAERPEDAEACFDDWGPTTTTWQRDSDGG